MFKFTKPSNFAEGLFNVSFIVSIFTSLIFLIRPDKVRNSIPFLAENKHLAILLCILTETLIVILLAIVCLVKKRMENKIIRGNLEITAEVVSIGRNVFFKVPAINKDTLISPYIIKYKYKYLDREYISKSQYIWEIPKWSVGNGIQILLDRDNPYKNIVKI